MKNCTLNNPEFTTCCCNCRNLVQINKHPGNVDFGKGRVTERMGYGCLALWRLEHIVVFMDTNHGLCELHDPR
jgi:hypothetical protein